MYGIIRLTPLPMRHFWHPFRTSAGSGQLRPTFGLGSGRRLNTSNRSAGRLPVSLAAPRTAALEVVCDASGFIAHWGGTEKTAGVAEAADYPVSHIDLGGRHGWLMAQRERVGGALQDPDWPGDAKVAGWWLWGQCCWIGSGWCEWDRAGSARGQRRDGRTGDREGDDATSAGRGVQAIGQVPHASLHAGSGRTGDREGSARQ